MNTVWATGLADLAEHYDAMVVDQYGVLHNGLQPYPGAADALLAWKALGKRVIVLSNSGKRASHNAKRLAQFGVSPAHYDWLMSSGECAHHMFRRDQEAAQPVYGKTAFVLQPEDAPPMLEGLPIRCVESIDQADMVVLISLPEKISFSHYESLLAQALKLQLPLICANPDRLRLTAQGVEPACGALAQRYADWGGQVVWIGKPYPLIYAACREQLNHWGANRVLAVGDSLEHDIAGGAAAAMDTCFITNGLHAEAFGAQVNAAQREALLDSLCADPASRCPQPPSWVLPNLTWSTHQT